MFPKETKEAIQEIFEHCRQRYPGIDLPFDLFCRKLQEIFPGRGVEAGPLPQEWARLHLEDLYLAAACALNDPAAWKVFADEHLPELKRSAVYACRNREDGEDLAQEIFAGLMNCAAGCGSPVPGDCGEAPRPSGLAGYNGRGSLKSWLRVSAAHAAIDRLRKMKKEVPLGDEGGSSPVEPVPVAPEASPGQEPLDDGWGRIIGEAVACEIGKLPPADRLMLGLYYVEGLPLQAIGRRFGFHEATASRRLEKLRRAIRKGVEKELGRRHGLRSRELQGLWQTAAGDGSFSLNDALAPAAENPGSRKKGAQGGRFFASNKLRIRR